MPSLQYFLISPLLWYLGVYINALLLLLQWKCYFDSKSVRYRKVLEHKINLRWAPKEKLIKTQSQDGLFQKVKSYHPSQTIGTLAWRGHVPYDSTLKEFTLLYKYQSPFFS